MDPLTLHAIMCATFAIIISPLSFKRIVMAITFTMAIMFNFGYYMFIQQQAKVALLEAQVAELKGDK